MSQGLTIHLENEDKRGSVFSGRLDDKEQCLIVEIRKGEKRGGHFHDIDTYHFIVVGKVKYFEKNMKNNGDIIEKEAGTGTKINTPANAAHYLVALENSIMVELSPPKKETTKYEPFRNIVLGNNQE